jgi:GTP cyclohydrolase I
MRSARGVRSHDARMTTFARRGVYAADQSRGVQAVQLVRDMARDMARRG